MKALIPVAGIGTRLKPLTNKIPKVLINVAGRPMLFHLIDELVRNKKIDTIIIVIGYLGEKIRNAVNNHYSGTSVRFEFVEQKEMLGLGHAVYHGKELVGEEPLLIVLGDTIFELNLEVVLSSSYSAIGIKEVVDITRWGIVESENGFVKRMIEKPSPSMTRSKSAIAGIYFLESGKKLFNAVEFLMRNNLKTKNEFQLTDALQKLVDDGQKMVTFDINWFDCGKPETLLNANEHLLKRDFDKDPGIEFPNTEIIPPVFIGKNCLIDNSIIGPFCTIADGTVVSNSKVVNSLLCENSHVVNAELNEVIVGNSEMISYYRKRIVKADGTIATF